MTKLQVPSREGDDVVEMDAMDVREWEQGQRTPQASDANLAALVKQSAKAQEPVEAQGAHGSRKAKAAARARSSGLPSPRPSRVGAPSATLDTSDTMPATRPAPPTKNEAPAAPKPTTRAITSRPGASRPKLQGLAAGPAVPIVAVAGISPMPTKPGPALPSVAEPEPDPPRHSSRPLSSMRVGVARAASAADEARSEFAVQQAAPPGPQLQATEHRVPLGPLPVTANGGTNDPPLPSESDPSLSADLVAMMDQAASPWPERRARLERSLRRAVVAIRGSRAAACSRRAIAALAGVRAAAASRRAIAALAGVRAAASSRRAIAALAGLRAAASSRPTAVWIGSAAGFVVFVVILAVAGGGQPSAVATSVQIDEPAQGSTAPARIAVTAMEEPVALSSLTSTALATPTVRAPAPAATSTPKRKPSVAAIRPVQPPARKLASAKLVVEYTGTENEAARPGLAAQTAEDPAIARARSAYVAGNQKLFAGDAEGAVRSYRQALGHYPGYVGGYRGLGLAYAQLGDNQKALEALQTYVSTAPNAKDITLIKKRIAHLQGK